MKHLHRYLAEFDFRHSTHKLTDTERTHIFMRQTGRHRLSYKPLAG